MKWKNLRSICIFCSDLFGHQVEVWLGLSIAMLQTSHYELKVVVGSFGRHGCWVDDGRVVVGKKIDDVVVLL